MRRSLHTMLSIAKLSILALTLSFTVSAQNESQKPQERLIHAGIVNGTAKSLPKPEYPSSAVTERAAGQIKVDVVIDETGRVISAEVIEGIENAALRESAKTAARKAQFSPLTNGKPVKFKGTIVYNFVLPTVPNAERLKYLNFAIALTTAKSFDDDPERFKIIFQSRDLISTTVADLPQYATELESVRDLSSVAPSMRRAVIDEAISAVESKAAPYEKWQIAVGRELGGLIGPLMYEMALTLRLPPEAFTKYGVEAFRGHLSRLAPLIANAPSDAPEDVVRRLAELAALHERDDLLSPENVLELKGRLQALADTMSREQK